MTDRIACPYCHKTGWVRSERIVKGRLFQTERYCGACDRTWVVSADGKTHTPIPTHDDRPGRVVPPKDRFKPSAG